MRAHILTCLFVLGQVGLIPAQQKSWRQYTTDHGLPSNEVYDMVQDSRGYLWFATDRGICKFNGYEFILPVDTSAEHGSAAFIPTFDAKGMLWFVRGRPSLWYIENDTIRAWKFNGLLNAYRGEILDQLGIEEDGTIWLAMGKQGFVIVSPDGIANSVRRSQNTNFTFVQTGHKVVFASQGPSPSKNNTNAAVTDIISIHNTDGILAGNTKYVSMPASFYRGIWSLKNGDLIHDHGGQLFYISQNKITWSCETHVFAEKIVQTPDDEILVASHFVPYIGLHYYATMEDLKQGKSDNLLPGHLVTDVLCDREGGWWATTKNAGVFYCENPNLGIYNMATGLSSNDIVRLAHDGDNRLFAAHRTSTVSILNRKNEQFENIPIPPEIHEIFALSYDAQNEKLWCGPMLHSLDSKRIWKESSFYDPQLGNHRVVSAKKILIDTSNHHLYACAPSGFFKINLNTLSCEMIGREGDTFDRTYSIAKDKDDNLWVVTSEGLKQWVDNAYKEPFFTHPVLHYQPLDVEVMPDGTIAIGFRAEGLLLKDNQDHFTHLTTKDGLTSDYISKLSVTQEGELLVCTNVGLNRVRKEDGSWQIETLTVKQGLPSNHVQDATSFGGEIWVATNQGLARFRNAPEQFSIPTPEIDGIVINNSESVDTSITSLPFHENNVSVRYHALHYRSSGDILYRYRLLGADTTFTETNAREVNFAHLRAGNYAFEVQARNKNGEWSLASKWSFEIYPAWWQTWWFRGAIALAGFAVLWYIFQRRLAQTRRQFEIQNKIRDLEAAALRAQMNPHFIFNCLVSIQQFISENDADAATSYLARFARLVRLALHSSVDGRHSLKEEIEMLENYLALEQLRFKNKFNYRIDISPGLNTNDITLPPMLIQPFVENAIVHGMKNKAGDGKIELSFSQKANHLMVTVTDNGPGIQVAIQAHEEKEHKSVGMSVTQRRLDLLEGYGDNARLRHEHVMGMNGEVMGSRVMVEIPME